jgi:rhamnose utilization protein RhaD (predicted bifunctional aldolase and dehydrogenase)/NAD(P)-dependent dehydrogenase (short-subunit alcohol dehydrogenase family)
VSERTSGVGTAPASPDDLLDEIVALARRYGGDPEYTRAGGGNASVKAGGVLYIKPSGVAMATLATEHLVPLDIATLLDRLAGPERSGGEEEAGSDPIMRVAAAARLAEAGGRRPSVELLFHALIPERFVLHTHPLVPNMVTCNRDGETITARLFGDEVLWVPYVDPGLPLARVIVERRRAYEERTGRPAPRVAFMQNHGIIVSADSVEEIDDLSERVMATVARETQGARASGTPARLEAHGPSPDPTHRRGLVAAIGPVLRASLGSGERLKVVTFDSSERAARYPATPSGRAFVEGGPMTPDQIVYAGSWPLVVDPPAEASPDAVLPAVRQRLDALLAERGTAPIITVVPGVGIFAAGDSWAQADTARHLYLDALRVAEGAERLGEVRALSPAERGFIEAWEAEAYRKGVAAAGQGAGRFAGRIAVVTGAAQGFGLAIASDLVAQGGHVALADLNVDLAEANAREIEARHGPGRAMAVSMDVRDERSVSDGIHAVVERYGGFDLLVSNAGVLRAGGVTSQPLEEFDLVTRVNYRGYFLAVRAAAPVLALQHRTRPGYRGDIVEINSKSGLAGSSRNSAYAGSKFGGIGLTQSFALELIDEGIKVNAICPGNFLDGPLWSDPENGLFVQYLRAGKVPGARTVEDVRRSYEEKVPMGRGCTPADVLEALYYLVAQQYETGQALPVTGGQVMLS